MYPSITLGDIWNPSVTFQRKQYGTMIPLVSYHLIHQNPPLLIKGLSHIYERYFPSASQPSQTCRCLLEELLHLCSSPSCLCFPFVVRGEKSSGQQQLQPLEKIDFPSNQPKEKGIWFPIPALCREISRMHSKWQVQENLLSNKISAWEGTPTDRFRIQKGLWDLQWPWLRPSQ